MIEVLDTLEEVLIANLKALRGKETQEAFAQRAKIPHPTYRDAENGTIPRDATLTAIAKAHNVPKMSLFMDPDLRGFTFVRKPTPEEALEVLREALLAPKSTKSALIREIAAALTPLDETQVRLWRDDILKGVALSAASNRGELPDETSEKPDVSAKPRRKSR